MLGAALAWLFDRQSGALRRARLKEKAAHAGRSVAGAADVAARDIAHRTRGAALALQHRLERGKDEGAPVDDGLLAERVRARLGHVCSHPAAIAVGCRDGRVRLHGPILASEVDQVLRAVRKVKGVREIDDALEPHRGAGEVPALQGGSGRRVERSAFRQEHWSPAARTAAGTAGAGLLAWALLRRTAFRTTAGLAGLGLLLRSLTNLPARRLVGVGAGRRAIDVKKDLFIDAAVEEVFAFFQELENFPRFMSHVREVVALDDEGRRWRWTVTGPLGALVSWDAEVTQFVPNEVIAWKSVEGATVRNHGVIRFAPERGGTRVAVRLSYNPPAGAIGHALVAALGASPRKQLDDDLLRFKSLIETGKATGHSGTALKEDIFGAAPHPIH